MRTEARIALVVLFLTSWACDHLSTPYPNSSANLWSIGVLACADGVVQGYAPDGNCTIGANGDLALSPITVTLKDLAEKEYASGSTDGLTGQASLQGELPEGHSPQIGYPSTAIAEGVGMLESPTVDQLTIVVNGKSASVVIPYRRPVKQEPPVIG